jgi:hypothetical protein
MKNNRTGGNCSCAESGPNRSNANAAEKIRDIGDNVPPGNNDWRAVEERAVSEGLFY